MADEFFPKTKTNSLKSTTMRNLKFHPYGQGSLVALPKGSTVQDLKSLAFFNRVIRNYLKMLKIQNTPSR